MFIVGKSFFSKTLSNFYIKTIAALCVIHIPKQMLAVGPLGPQYILLNIALITFFGQHIFPCDTSPLGTLKLVSIYYLGPFMTSFAYFWPIF